jgi:signal transduction histidine kinase
MCPVADYLPTSGAAIEAVQRAGAGGVDTRTVTFRGSPYRVLSFAFPTTQGVYVIQISRIASGEEDALDHLRLVLLLGGIVAIVVSAAGSLFLANKALVPIRQAFSRQRQFTADASHELRTPLALIRANAEMLSRHLDRLPPSDSELVGEIIDETDHLNRLVSDLLTLARADAESVKIENKPVDFRSLVNDVHEDVQRIAESRGIRSDVTLDGPVTVAGDEVRLRQLILILLDNALKYTDPGGRVDVSLARHDNHARLAVSDSGIGIPAADLPHIFDRFYRVDRAREHESGGTGLGLSIAKWIAQAHGGTIKVESAVGKGSTFLVDLPAA